MNPEVTTYLDALNLPWQVEICNQIRQAIHTAVPDIVERIQYRKPHFLRNGKYVAVISPAKGWISFTLFNADGIENSLFEPSDVTDRKTIKFKPGQTVDSNLLITMITASAKML